MRAVGVLGAVLLVAAIARGDIGTRTSPAPGATSDTAAAEPIRRTAAVSAPGDESPLRDPFTPYTVVNPRDPARKPVWSYADLRPDEQAVIDRGRDTTKWAVTHAAFTATTAELAVRAQTAAASARLGAAGDLSMTGVVP
jgi:hypothetical protein